MIGLSLLSVFAIKWVNGHSWLECTDYNMNINLEAANYDNSFDHNSCGGYPRNYFEWGDRDFGAKPGIDHELGDPNDPNEDGDPDGLTICDVDTQIGSPNNNYGSSYTTQFPMANYNVGETYRLIWPAKNHGVDASCNEKELDNAMKLFVNLIPNPTSDLGNGGVEIGGTGLVNDGWTLVIDWHEASGVDFPISYDGISTEGVHGIPFAQCPKFCDEKDKAVCYGDVTIPDIFPQSGVYTFLWYWELGYQSPYTHCFEVYVTAPANTQTNPPTPRPTDADVSNPATNPPTEDNNGGNNGGNQNTGNGGNNGGNNGESQDTETTKEDGSIPLQTGDGQTSNQNNKGSNDDSSGDVVIILVIVIVILVLLIIVGIAVFICKNKEKNKDNHKENVFANVVNTQQTNTQAITAVNDDDHPRDGMNYPTNNNYATGGTGGYGANGGYGNNNNYGGQNNGYNNGAASRPRPPPPRPPVRY